MFAEAWWLLNLLNLMCGYDKGEKPLPALRDNCPVEAEHSRAEMVPARGIEPPTY